MEEKREQIIQKTLEKNIEKTTEKILYATIEMKREHTILNTVLERRLQRRLLQIPSCTSRRELPGNTEESLLYSREDSQINIEKNYTHIRLLRREEYQLNS